MWDIWLKFWKTHVWKDKESPLSEMGVLIPTEVVGEVDKISSKFILCDHVGNSHDNLFYTALILQGEILC